MEPSAGWCSTPRRRSAFALVALVLAALAATLFRPPPTPGPFARDFEAYYAAGATWNAGRDPYSRDVWQVERTIAGVDATHDELLPFVGPAASLPLWSLFARLPFDAARIAWELLLALAFAVLALAAAAMAYGRLTFGRAGSALLFGGLTGPLISDIALGQVALVSAAAVAVALLALERRSPWAILAACVAGIQPNLAIPLAVWLTERRAALFLGAAAAAFLALTLVTGGGVEGVPAYVRLLARHGAAERSSVIQYGAPAILALFAVLLTAAGAWRWRTQPRAAAMFALALLPWAVPFFHEHDFVLELIPAIVLAASPHARVRMLAGVAALATLVDWLGIAQHPHAAAQTVCLAFALACAYAVLPNRSYAASALPPLAAAAVLALIAVPLALIFPAPVWPDALGPFHAAPNLDASAVWAAEQQRAGLAAAVPAWGVLRAIPLAGCALLALAVYVAAASAAVTTRPARIASGTAVSDLPSHGPATQ